MSMTRIILHLNSQDVRGSLISCYLSAAVLSNFSNYPIKIFGRVKKMVPNFFYCRLFSQWVTAVNEFMQSCVDVVRSILHPPMLPKISTDESPVCEKEKNTCEIIYHTLFMSFSKIFLLHPR